MHKRYGVHCNLTVLRHNFSKSVILVTVRDGMNFGRTGKSFKPTPPDKGSFPLDHDGECRPFMVNYMRCLCLNDNANDKCRHQAKSYLECRMDRELMCKEEFTKLGFNEPEVTSTSEALKKSVSSQ